VELVFFDVECFEFVPVELNCVLEALEHLQQGALVAAVSF
jgi:hypothetical protein